MKQFLFVLFMCFATASAHAGDAYENAYLTNPDVAVPTKEDAAGFTNLEPLGNHEVVRQKEATSPVAPKKVWRLGVVLDKPDGTSKAYPDTGHGAVVAAVVRGSPAWYADILPGDTITEMDGQKVQSAADVAAILSGLAGKTAFDITICRIRDGVHCMGRRVTDAPQEAADQAVMI